MSDPKDYADLLGCTIVALDDSREQIRKLEAEVQRLEHTVNYWKIEAKTDHERWERQMEENARLRSDIKALEKDSLAANVLRLGNEVRDLAAENTRLKAEVERLRASSFVTAVPSEHYERVIKAGDAMAVMVGHIEITGDAHRMMLELSKDWNAAKEGKQP